MIKQTTHDYYRHNVPNVSYCSRLLTVCWLVFSLETYGGGSDVTPPPIKLLFGDGDLFEAFAANSV